MVDGVHPLRLLQEHAGAQRLHLAGRGRLEEGHHHDEEHHRQLPDPEDLRGLDVVDEGPELGVELVGGDEVECLGLPEVLTVGQREGVLTASQVNTDGRLEDLTGADVVSVQRGSVRRAQAAEAVQAGEEEPHPGHGLGEQPGHHQQVVSPTVGGSENKSI